MSFASIDVRAIAEANAVPALVGTADFDALKQRKLDEAWCGVFDVFRATSSMITALANGAVAIVPVSEISEALRGAARCLSLLAGDAMSRSGRLRSGNGF
jgi:hypothetical protein